MEERPYSFLAHVQADHDCVTFRVARHTGGTLVSLQRSAIDEFFRDWPGTGVKLPNWIGVAPSM